MTAILWPLAEAIFPLRPKTEPLLCIFLFCCGVQKSQLKEKNNQILYIFYVLKALGIQSLPCVSSDMFQKKN